MNSFAIKRRRYEAMMLWNCINAEKKAREGSTVTCMQRFCVDYAIRLGQLSVWEEQTMHSR